MRNTIKSALFAFLFVTLLFTINPKNSYAFTGMDILGLDVETQEKTQWCWAASSVGILDYYNISKTQSQFVKQVMGSVVNVPAADSEAESGMDAFGISGTVTSSSLSYDQVYTQIYTNDDPIYAGWSWDAGGGHAVVIMGFNNFGGSDVYYEDPGDGSRYRVTHSWMQSGGGHVWDGSIYNLG